MGFLALGSVFAAMADLAGAVGGSVARRGLAVREESGRWGGRPARKGE